jgi:hypothetical protein
MKKSRAYLIVATMFALNLALFTLGPIFRIASDDVLTQKYVESIFTWSIWVSLFTSIALFLVHRGSTKEGIHIAVVTAPYVFVLQNLLMPLLMDGFKSIATRILY